LLVREFPGCERPYGGSLSLDRDLRGGIGEGPGGHVAGVPKVDRVGAGDDVEGDASTGVLESQETLVL